MNPTVFGELITQHGPRLVSTMTRVMRNQQDGEDVAITALARAYDRYATFRGDSSLYTWVQAIAFNEARNVFHSRRKARLESLETCTEPLAMPERAEDRSEQNLQCMKLKHALRKIPLKYRIVLLRHFIDDEPIKQIASDLDIPVGTVLSRMFKAKALLRRAWGGV